MELKLKLDGKTKTFKSKKITFGIFRKSVEYLGTLGETFLGDNYPQKELDEAVDFIVEYFGCTKEEFYDGFEMLDSIDFFSLFQAILHNIQMNDGRRTVEKDSEGK
ncbi:hypothetical protein R6Z02_12805 [Carnobacterium maltaromaticum]|uniref:phage tail assembly chaperone G n=1 Tax=Carnobacterium maltaromaticum TaxID=2751 RepID=UPI00298B3721|nr:hypothetical protein [Carnobacterium maltaromaticum]MDW5524631.1 hypothetical protein [Carnobacterium maltaromaticum]